MLNHIVIVENTRAQFFLQVRPGGCGFDPRRGRQHSFVEIDHEIFSIVILSLPLIQEGQLSVSGERMQYIILVKCAQYWTKPAQ